MISGLNLAHFVVLVYSATNPNPKHNAKPTPPPPTESCLKVYMDILDGAGDSDSDSDDDEIPLESRPESNGESTSWLGDLIQAGINLFTSTIDEEDGSISDSTNTSAPTSPSQALSTPERDRGVDAGALGALDASHPVVVALEKLVNGVISRDEYEHIATVHAMMDEVSSPGNRSPVRGAHRRGRGGADNGGDAASSTDDGRGGGGGGSSAVPSTCSVGFREAVFHVPASVPDVGIVVGLDGSDCVVQEVAPGSWAAAAGLRVGDAVDAVDGSVVAGWSPADVHAALMRGRGGDGIAPLGIGGGGGDVDIDLAIFLQPATRSGIGAVGRSPTREAKPLKRETPMFLTLDVSKTDGVLSFAYEVVKGKVQLAPTDAGAGAGAGAGAAGGSGGDCGSVVAGDILLSVNDVEVSGSTVGKVLAKAGHHFHIDIIRKA